MDLLIAVVTIVIVLAVVVSPIMAHDENVRSSKKLPLWYRRLLHRISTDSYPRPQH